MSAMNDLIRALNRLDSWVSGYYAITLDKAASELASNYRDNIKAGVDANGSPLAPLKASTINSHIRRGLARGGSNNAIRSSLGATPLSATGATAGSIEAKRTGPGNWEIASQTDLGDAILASNAKSGHRGFPFRGDTPKPVRDPLTVGEKQLDIVENRLADDLERLLLW